VSTDVPQIWLTYREFAALMNCDLAEARQAAIAASLDRRKSRDGQTRVKLTDPLADAFLDAVMRQFLECNTTVSVGRLRAIGEIMGKPSARLAG
jgi:hypothetical protein